VKRFKQKITKTYFKSSQQERVIYISLFKKINYLSLKENNRVDVSLLLIKIITALFLIHHAFSLLVGVFCLLVIGAHVRAHVNPEYNYEM